MVMSIMFDVDTEFAWSCLQKYSYNCCMREGVWFLEYEIADIFCSKEIA